MRFAPLFACSTLIACNPGPKAEGDSSTTAITSTTGTPGGTPTGTATGTATATATATGTGTGTGTGTSGWTPLASPASAGDAQATFTLPSVNGSLTDHFVAHVGDQDGDGFDELFIASPRANNLEGWAWLVYGHSSPSGDTDLTAEPALLGSNVSTLGEATGGTDLDGDGFADLLIGSPALTGVEPTTGAVHLRYGSTTRITSDTDPIASFDAHFEGLVQDARVGQGVLPVGDMDGDGLQDIAVTAFADLVGDQQTGSVHLLYGNTTRLTGTQPISALPALAGETGEQVAGRNALAAGDIDGDGAVDLFVGGTENPPGDKVYVVYGNNARLPAGLTQLATVAHAQITATNPYGGSFGDALDVAQDVDGDGYDDLVVGAFDYDGLATRTGMALVFAGGSARMSGTLGTTDAVAELLGTEDRSQFGWDVASADLDLDGLGDLLIGVPHSDQPYTDAGSLLVYPGGAIAGTLTVADAQLRVDGEASLHDLGESISTGDFDGDGWPDVCVSSPGWGGPRGRANWFPGGLLL